MSCIYFLCFDTNSQRPVLSWDTGTASPLPSLMHCPNFTIPLFNKEVDFLCGASEFPEEHNSSADLNFLSLKLGQMPCVQCGRCQRSMRRGILQEPSLETVRGDYPYSGFSYQGLRIYIYLFFFSLLAGKEKMI